ncbi:peptide-methionine (S)-S-oxide reductase MsrA [Neptuniibacter sp. 1_MG-2023]|jgi:peptide-methionine (S)-S-oxide reductase|uniref:peptide-methionine (S)-S-oxide reductase MsrA n=1 Tax=Neptuniibacter sp. 1_MG-2023 TaxID=3062662 RepID=UPI0026E3D9CD|nr:peptide-methionine (S)-S-oxide reductase MsrA [Neptuniibacter sp. 1_MG-2023]MDO6592732.1 peptide-methionine (S)-S-oxide reductase MsrA [Neptuniibacter sp. 1_MG-2023]
MNIATFAAGCFWGIELHFSKLPGVTSTAVGYMGGHNSNPSYQDVCTGDTNHAEVVQVTFDRQETSYEELLNAFWSAHNPTTLNRQGPDIGTQYRSAIFYHNEEQKRFAELSKEKLDNSGLLPSKIVTAIVPAETFWPAEEYHQKYLEKRGMGGCGI